MALDIRRYVGNEEIVCGGMVHFNGLDRGLWDVCVTPTRIIACSQREDAVGIILLRQVNFVNLCQEGTMAKYKGWNVEIFCGNIRCNTLVTDDFEKAEALFNAIQHHATFS